MEAVHRWGGLGWWVPRVFDGVCFEKMKSGLTARVLDFHIYKLKKREGIGGNSYGILREGWMRIAWLEYGDVWSGAAAVGDSRRRQTAEVQKG